MGRCIVFLVVLLLSAQLALSLGLSYEYMEDNTLHLTPGESYFFKLTLQNEEEDDVAVSIELDSDIAILVGDPDIVVKGKTYGSFVYFNITLPKNADPDKTYQVRYVISPQANSEGQVPFAVRYDRNIIVKVKEGSVPAREAPEDIGDVLRANVIFDFLESTWISLVLLVIIIFLVVLIWKKSSTITAKTFRKAEKSEVTKTERIQDELKRRRKLHALHRRSSVDKAFLTRRGEQLRDLIELRAALSRMDSDTFDYHVNDERNDFGAWTADVLELHDIADKIKRAKTADEMRAVLEGEFKYLNMLEFHKLLKQQRK